MKDKKTVIRKMKTKGKEEEKKTKRKETKRKRIYLDSTSGPARSN